MFLFLEKIIISQGTSRPPIASLFLPEIILNQSYLVLLLLNYMISKRTENLHPWTTVFLSIVNVPFFLSNIIFSPSRKCSLAKISVLLVSIEAWILWLPSLLRKGVNQGTQVGNLHIVYPYVFMARSVESASFLSGHPLTQYSHLKTIMAAVVTWYSPSPLFFSIKK